MTNQEEREMTENLNAGTFVGNVYVFNLTSQDLNLSTNGAPIAGGTIPGWAQSGSRYQPSSQAVPRKLNASDGPSNFFNGGNSLSLNWIDGLYFAYVNIDGTQLPLNQDILLIIERNQWQLVNQYAVEVARGDVTPAALLRAALGAAEA
ncbi:MAG TPA: hypothetical protein VJS15_06660 [Allosphingosinicella sp.]|nr:hypothetical protein [Allosphingosinicella sp.]